MQHFMKQNNTLLLFWALPAAIQACTYQRESSAMRQERVVCRQRLGVMDEYVGLHCLVLTLLVAEGWSMWG